MNQRQFNNIVLPLKNKLFRFAFSFLKNEEEAKDVVQEVMLKCWEVSQKKHQIQNYEAWCMTLTRNRSLDRLKKKGRHSDTLSEHFDLSSDGLSPFAITQAAETKHVIHSIIDRLPVAQKEAITLRDLEGYSYKEIAEIMHINMNHVKVLLHRARSTVKTQLTRIHNYGIA